MATRTRVHRALERGRRRRRARPAGGARGEEAQAARASPRQHAARRPLLAGRAVGRSRAGRDHAAHARGRRRRRRPGAARGGARPGLPQGGRPARHPHHAVDPPLGQGARDRPAPAPALLLPLRDARPAQPGRPLPDGAAAGLARDRPLRLLLLRRLHARLLQRVRAAGGGGPRLRRLPGRLHLRRDLRAARRRPRGPRRHDRQAAALLPHDPARGGHPAGVPRGSTRCTGPIRRCASCTRRSPSWPRGTTTRSRTTTRTTRRAAGCRCAPASPAPAATPPTRPGSRRCRCSRAAAPASTARRRTGGRST